MAKKIKDYTCNISFFALDSTGEYEDEGHIFQNKALGDFLVSKNVVDAEEAYELYKAIFGDEDLDSFEDFEPLYNSGLFEKVVIVTEEMVETLQDNLAKYGLDGYNFVYPKGEFVAFISHYAED